jgi:hypothetical protein
MATFNFELDQKATIWYKTKFQIEAETLEEAKQIAVQKINFQGLEESWEEIEGTQELIFPNDNDGEPTEELFIQGQENAIWSNA